MWFVYTILGLYLIIPILRKWVKQSSQNEILFFLIIWGISILKLLPFFGENIINIELQYFSGYIGFIVLGYYLSIISPVKRRYAALCFLLGSAITIYGTHYYSVLGNTFTHAFYDYLKPNVILSAIGLFLLFKGVSIPYKWIHRAFLSISKHSYGIYLIHILVLQKITAAGVYWDMYSPIVMIPFITALVFTISFFIIFILKKIKLISPLIG